jgi:hypothetical protein
VDCYRGFGSARFVYRAGVGVFERRDVSGVFLVWWFIALEFVCVGGGYIAVQTFAACSVLLVGEACFRVGLHALPLCGAALTFFAAAKKVSKESRSHR